MKPWEHDHTFGQDRKMPGEVRTLIVVVLTAATMVLEIVAGIFYGSMALLADGLHMASHASALVITTIAYIYARRSAHDERYSFGTGKVNSLAGFTGAVLLAVFSLMMAGESIQRLLAPVQIAFNQALLVAVVGLLVNGVSVIVLGDGVFGDGSGHDHAREDASAGDEAGNSERDSLQAGHGALPATVDACAETGFSETCTNEDAAAIVAVGRHHVADEADEQGVHRAHKHDHNLRSAYLHVLADTLTSVLAILALLAGKYFGLTWLDPVMGIVGAALVARWSLGLLKTTAVVLLDRQGPEPMRSAIRRAVEQQGDEVIDLHLWVVGPGAYALILGVRTQQQRRPDFYRQILPAELHLVHVTVEVW